MGARPYKKDAEARKIDKEASTSATQAFQPVRPKLGAPAVKLAQGPRTNANACKSFVRSNSCASAGRFGSLIAFVMKQLSHKAANRLT